MKNTFTNLINSIKSDKALQIILLILFVAGIAIFNSLNISTTFEDKDIPFKVATENSQNTTNNNNNIYPPKEAENLKLLDKKRDRALGLTVYEHYHGRNDFYAQTHYAVDKNNNIEYTVKLVQPYQKLTLDTYVKENSLPEPDLIKYPKVNTDHAAYIYLNKGMMLYVRHYDQKISQEIYFEPTTVEKFMETWGTKLADEKITEEEFSIL